MHSIHYPLLFFCWLGACIRQKSDPWCWTGGHFITCLQKIFLTLSRAHCMVCSMDCGNDFKVQYGTSSSKGSVWHTIHNQEKNKLQPKSKFNIFTKHPAWKYCLSVWETILVNTWFKLLTEQEVCAKWNKKDTRAMLWELHSCYIFC